MALAGVDLEEGRPADAEREAQQAVEEFRKAKDADSHANIEVALVDALLAQHKINQAESAIADATKLVAKSQQPFHSNRRRYLPSRGPVRIRKEH